MSRFHQNRLALRAMLISALLILGHVVLTTTAANPYVGSHDKGVPALKSTSSLIFLTLLWTTFTLLEAVDAQLVPTFGLWIEDKHAEGLIFGRTWVDFVLNSALLAAWAIWSTDTLLIITSLSPFVCSELILIPVAYVIAIVALAGLQAQLTRSILGRVFAVGMRKTFLSSTFWNTKTGHWSEHIKLRDVDKEYLVTIDVKELEEEEEVWENLGEKMDRVVSQL